MLRRSLCACSVASLLACLASQAVAQLPKPPAAGVVYFEPPANGAPVRAQIGVGQSSGHAQLPKPNHQPRPDISAPNSLTCACEQAEAAPEARSAHGGAVEFEVQFVSARTALATRLLAHARGEGDGTDAGDSPISLDHSQVRQMLEAAQADAWTNVTQTPQMTVLSGQRSTLRVAQGQSFVTGVELTTQGGHLVALPKTEKVGDGVELSLRPEVSADRRFVRVGLRIALRTVEESAPAVPVALVIQPQADAGNPKPQPVVLTQHIQRPSCQTVALDKVFMVPAGRTAVLDAGTRTREVREVSKVPVLGDIPILQCLFTKESRTTETERVLVLVTPRVLQGQTAKPPSCEARPRTACCAVEAACPACPPCTAREADAAALVAAYRAACHEGRLDEARELAVKALALDPACFSKRPADGVKSSPRGEKPRR